MGFFVILGVDPTLCIMSQLNGLIWEILYQCISNHNTDFLSLNQFLYGICHGIYYVFTAENAKARKGTRKKMIFLMAGPLRQSELIFCLNPTLKPLYFKKSPHWPTLKIRDFS